MTFKGIIGYFLIISSLFLSLNANTSYFFTLYFHKSNSLEEGKFFTKEHLQHALFSKNDVDVLNVIDWVVRAQKINAICMKSEFTQYEISKIVLTSVGSFCMVACLLKNNLVKNFLVSLTTGAGVWCYYKLLHKHYCDILEKYKKIYSYTYEISTWQENPEYNKITFYFNPALRDIFKDSRSFIKTENEIEQLMEYAFR